MIKLEYTDKKNWETINSIFSKPLEKNLRISHFFVVVIFFRLILICYSGTDLFFFKKFIKSQCLWNIWFRSRSKLVVYSLCYFVVEYKPLFLNGVLSTYQANGCFMLCVNFFVSFIVCVYGCHWFAHQNVICVWQNTRINFYIQILIETCWLSIFLVLSFRIFFHRIIPVWQQPRQKKNKAIFSNICFQQVNLFIPFVLE